MDLQPLLDTLSKVSGGRIYPDHTLEKEDDLTRVRIPVTMRNVDDPKDTVLRRFAKDWVRNRKKNIGIDVRHERLPPGTVWWDRRETEPKQVPAQAALVLTWWPKPELSEMERDARDRAKAKAQRLRDHREELKTQGT